MTKAVIKNSSGRIVDSSNDIILNRIKSGENGGELYTTKYERYHTSFAFGCAARLVRLFKDDTTKIREFLNCSGVCYHFGHTTPLARLVYDYDDCDGTISGVKLMRGSLVSMVSIGGAQLIRHGGLSRRVRLLA